MAILLSLVAPYTAEEMWELLGHQPSVARAGWPAADPALLVEDLVTCVVQVAGKVRDRLEVPPGIGEDELRELALAAPGRPGAGRAPVRTVIVRAPSLVNIVPPDAAAAPSAKRPGPAWHPPQPDGLIAVGQAAAGYDHGQPCLITPGHAGARSDPAQHRHDPAQDRRLVAGNRV